jgi:hypothetical protein
MRKLLFAIVVGAAPVAAVVFGCSSDGVSQASDPSPVGTVPSAADGATPPPRQDEPPGVDGGCLRDQPLADGGGVDACAPGPCRQTCENLQARYRPGVAAEAVACIGRLAACRSTDDVTACVDRAIARACTDPGATAYCDPLVQGCGPADSFEDASAIDPKACIDFGSALTDAGRGIFASCIQAAIRAGTCAYTVVQCADSIRR